MVHSGRTCQRTGPAAKHVVSHARMLGNRPKSCRWDLNPGPRPYQGRALPTEPRQQRCLSSHPEDHYWIRWNSLLTAAWKRRLDDHDRHASASGRERVMGIEPTQPAWKAGALPLSYTRVRFTVPAEKANMGGAGFEPAKAEPPDLQSGPFGRLGIHPSWILSSPRASLSCHVMETRSSTRVIDTFLAKQSWR